MGIGTGNSSLHHGEWFCVKKMTEEMLNAIEIEPKNGQRWLQCPHCGYNFAANAVIGGLREYVTAPGVLMCPECNKKFRILHIVRPFRASDSSGARKWVMLDEA